MIAINTDIDDVNEKLQLALIGINHLNDGIMITNENNKIIFLNKAIEKLTGYNENELLGKDPNILQSGLHDQNFYKQMWEMLYSNGRWEGEVLNRRKDGTLYFERLKIIAIKRTDGAITNYLAILSDITKEKKLEKDILIASQIQQQLFPKGIKNDYFQTKIFFKPKRYVSGDFYDYVWNKEKRKLYGVVGDFKGHGISSALLTSAMKVLFHKVIQERRTLEEIVKKINENSFKYFTDETFAAAIFFEIDYKRRKMTYVSAGINYFLLLTEERKQLVEVPGMFLGMFKDAHYEQRSLDFHKGDIFYFMSDGVIDGIPKNMNWERLDFQITYEKLEQIVNNYAHDDATFLGVEILKGEIMEQNVCRIYKIRKIDEFYSLKEQIVEILNKLSIVETDLIWMALIEGINNAWLHGNKRNDEKEIQLTIKSIRKKRVIFRIRDEGLGYSGNEQVRKFLGVVDEEFEKRMFDESGRGLLIMMKVFDKVIYNQKGNELFLVKNIDERGEVNENNN